ncbi:MAG: peptidoglycan-binding protein [Eubacteriales bacterium]|nr:peptidoglycan-binding protein [Eubacteriales bacterium]
MSTPAVANVVDVSKFYNFALPSKGGAVEHMQTRLNNPGYKLNVDHAFGALTPAAAMDFQKKIDFTVDRVIGQKTWAALAAKRADSFQVNWAGG